MIHQHRSDNGVLELVIERPPVNAFDIAVLQNLAAILRTVTEDESVRVVLLRSEGRGFCGGGDVKEVESLTGFDGILGQARGSMEASLAILNCAVPVICAAHEYCVGVGVLISGSADVLLTTPGTKFILAEIDNGATAGAAQALRLMPEKRLRVAMMTAEPVFAEELRILGTVHRIVPPDHLASEARDLASRIAVKNPHVLRRLKRSLNGTFNVAAIEILYRAELSYTYELNMLGDAHTGRSAFLTGQRKGYFAPG